MNRPAFEIGAIYHIYNRGTDKRTIFETPKDYQRFLSGMFEFNDERPALNWQYKNSLSEVQPRRKLVELLAYCLMPNHYHFMVRQIQDGGISLFMKKLGTGYTMYFNKKYDRSGALFQGQFKSIVVDRDEYLRYLPHYIHLNPLDLIMPDWRQRIMDRQKAHRYIKSYPWSSYNYLATGVASPELDDEFVKELYAPQGYRVALSNWFEDMDLTVINPITLE